MSALLLPDDATAHAAVAAAGNATPAARHYWITPGGGAYLQLRDVLHMSLPWARQLWHQGYAHARELDEAQYFSGMAPCRAH